MDVAMAGLVLTDRCLLPSGSRTPGPGGQGSTGAGIRKTGMDGVGYTAAQAETGGRSEVSDEMLVSEIRDGADWAAEALVRRYRDRAYAIAGSLCDGDRDLAGDMTQEAFLKAFRSLDRFRGQSSFYTWFYRILVNTCLDNRRKQRRWDRFFLPWRSARPAGDMPEKTVEDLPDASEESDPDLVLGSKALQEEVNEALKSLSAKQRTVFQLKVFHEMTLREIAEVMNLSEGTVKSHLFRATKSLRTTLKDWGKE